jgi:hypothetical protein
LDKIIIWVGLTHLNPESLDWDDVLKNMNIHNITQQYPSLTNRQLKFLDFCIYGRSADMNLPCICCATRAKMTLKKRE